AQVAIQAAPEMREYELIILFGAMFGMVWAGDPVVVATKVIFEESHSDQDGYHE
ncbi:unnamed protein product, partial [Prorocentrum cordatum]